MRKLIVLCTALVALQPCFAQVNVAKYHHEQVQFTKAAMYTLGGWAAVNIVTGTLLQHKAEGTKRHFYRGNAYWNIVNLGLASGSLIASNYAKTPSTFTNFLENERTLQQTFLFNTGLDLGYIAAGWALTERGKRKKNEKYEGYGKALLVQGGFLLVFDAVCYTLRSAKNKAFDDQLGAIETAAQSGTQSKQAMPLRIGTTLHF